MVGVLVQVSHGPSRDDLCIVSVQAQAANNPRRSFGAAFLNLSRGHQSWTRLLLWLLEVLRRGNPFRLRPMFSPDLSCVRLRRLCEGFEEDASHSILRSGRPRERPTLTNGDREVNG